MELLMLSLSLLLACLFLLLKFIARKPTPFIESLRDKHVFITGASSGIGLAIAKKAVLEGAFVSILSRNSSKLTEAADKLARETGCHRDRLRCHVADVGDHPAMANAIREGLQWKPIDVLVCNAGLTRGGYLGNGSVEDIDMVISTNLNGVIYPIHEALPSLKQHSLNHPVSIVLVSSIASLFFMYGHSVYTATKYALRGLAEGLRAELLACNVKVTLMCPGFVNTPFLDDVSKEGEITEIMKKVNLLDLKSSESPESVAVQTMEAVKRGSFIVVTQPVGIHLLALGRGIIPAENPLVALFELAILLPCRILSFHLASNVRHFILEGSHKPVKNI